MYLCNNLFSTYMEKLLLISTEWLTMTDWLDNYVWFCSPLNPCLRDVGGNHSVQTKSELKKTDQEPTHIYQKWFISGTLKSIKGSGVPCLASGHKGSDTGLEPTTNRSVWVSPQLAPRNSTVDRKVSNTQVCREFYLYLFYW